MLSDQENEPAGLFDFQVNGFGGVDFQRVGLSEAELSIAVGRLWSCGVSGILLTLVSDTIPSLRNKLENFETLKSKNPAIGSIICGYHLEGPWLSPLPGFHGAHPAEVMKAPSIADFNTLQTAANGCIRLVTLAPEWPGSEAFIQELESRNIRTSIGHSNAGDSDIDRAISAGLRFCTHLGNAVPQTLHRHDNIIQRLLARDELTACLIPDGVHLPFNVLKNYVRAKPAGKVLFTTDAMAGAGAPPGTYTLGRLVVEVGNDGIARQPGSQALAGSTLTPDIGVSNVSEFTDFSPKQARRIWSIDAACAFSVTLPRLPGPDEINAINQKTPPAI